MTADAYATSFMVLGLEKSIELAGTIKGLEVYFIYSDEKGETKSYFTDGFKDKITEEIK